ncbi:hypothetical protein MTR67_024986 [Solanum verrucosum]|uniref:Uncharacterized protein n=1 Tax=Solanum verrucosum TaxID=315347 RepID=A0AAF0R454_SOLVR|nr:hypothetical protein MTR67_024986 [Solanum verrucosum]
MVLEFFKDLYLRIGDLYNNIMFHNKDQEDETHQMIDFEKSSSDESLKYKNRGIDESQLKLERFKVKTPQVQPTGVGAKTSTSK